MSFLVKVQTWNDTDQKAERKNITTRSLRLGWCPICRWCCRREGGKLINGEVLRGSRS
jgi:hypothetical protein